MKRYYTATLVSTTGDGFVKQIVVIANCYTSALDRAVAVCDKMFRDMVVHTVEVAR